MTFRLLLMHPMDPRGAKLGGIETHVRQILARHPPDFRVIFVGVDEMGDLDLGRVAKILHQGREIEFLPVARIGGEEINLTAKSLRRSTTLRFALGALRHLAQIRAALRPGTVSADVQRIEFALLPKLLGVKTVLTIHNEATKDQKADSLTTKYWAAHRLSQKIALAAADHVFCVNAGIIERLREAAPRAAAKCELMTVAVDQKRFAPQPFDCEDDVFRVAFAGRLDAIKDPPLMFRTLAKVHERLGGRFEFHYIGASDPARYAESALIEAFMVRRGYQPADGVARSLARCHAGVLTSFFEGMTCFLLEALSVGRPFVALRLPQFDPVVVAGTSGFLIERTDPDDLCEARMVEAFLQLWSDIRSGRVDPGAVSALVAPYSVERQMSRLFLRHRALQSPLRATPESEAARAPNRIRRRAPQSVDDRGSV